MQPDQEFKEIATTYGVAEDKIEDLFYEVGAYMESKLKG